MKKAIIALAVTCSLNAGAIGLVVIVEFRAKAELESQVTAYLDDCGVEPTSIEVRGRPYLMYAAQDRADLTYVDTTPATGTNKDQLLVHRLVDGDADRLTRFITFDYPSEAISIKESDGSFSNSATIGGTAVTFSAETDAAAVRMFADGREAEEVSLPQSASVRNVSATDCGDGVEVEYAPSSCR